IQDYSDIRFPEGSGAMLMIEVDGPLAGLREQLQAVSQAAQVKGVLDIRVAETEQERKALWESRKALSPAQRAIAPKKINEDVVVPVSRLPELIEGLETLGQKYAIRIVNFGHAGNGNIHVNLLIDPDDPGQAEAAEQCLDEVFDLVLSLRGTLSGEHGIGLVKREFVSRELDETALALMKGIKQQFDPDQILNPGKLYVE
ncbi:MAG: FAD-binding oxidoreductase, partial [Gammaproteobacteria bacterium]